MTAESVIERAFELARSGGCQTMGDIRFQLRRERYPAAEVEPHLAGRLIQKQLKDAMAAAQSRDRDDTPDASPWFMSAPPLRSNP